ncbi:MAG: hypothetical protein KKE35_03240 [Actinobacteria bacterium]|nr:hypothetical protein [Actinomycetota bacterium]
MQVKDNKIQDIYIVPLFIKSLETFQAIYVLLRNCIFNDALNLTRILFEEMINLGYCAKGENKCKQYIAKEIKNKIKMINAAEQHPEEFPEELFQRQPLSDRKKELEKMLKEIGRPKNVSTEQMARELNLGRLYQVYYRMVSNEVHSNPESLNKYCKVGESGYIREFKFGPEIEENKVSVIFTGIEIMLIICKFLSDYFSIPKEEDYLKFNEIKKEIDEKYKNLEL